jgi:hypothetical protein
MTNQLHAAALILSLHYYGNNRALEIMVDSQFTR